MTRESRHIVIIGGGIVGVSIAYFLAQHKLFDSSKHKVTVIEAGEIAGGASGKAGGFLASWATPKCLAPLSFRLHGELAQQYNGSSTWGYRRVHAAEVKLQACIETPRESSELSEAQPKELDWLFPDCIQEYTEIGTPDDSAQAHPCFLTKSLAEVAQSKGVNFLAGTVTSIAYMESGAAVESVEYTSPEGNSRLGATDVVVAAGPWTPSLIPSIMLLAPKGHSIVVKPSRDLSPYILFPTIQNSSDTGTEKSISPDIYPRPGDQSHAFDTVYSSGPDYYDSPLPPSTSQVQTEDEKCHEVWTAIRSVSKEIGEGETITKQACYKAQIRKHNEGEEVGPILGPMDDVSGLWIATGFDEWGVQNAPGAGLVMSEMVLEGKAHSADVDALRPRHYINRSG